MPNFCHFNTDQVEQDFIREKKSAFREFEDQKVYLKDQLIAELEEKQKLIETERHNRNWPEILWNWSQLLHGNFDAGPMSHQVSDIDKIAQRLIQN